MRVRGLVDCCMTIYQLCSTTPCDILISLLFVRFRRVFIFLTGSSKTITTTTRQRNKMHQFYHYSLDSRYWNYFRTNSIEVKMSLSSSVCMTLESEDGQHIFQVSHKINLRNRIPNTDFFLHRFKLARKQKHKK